MNKRKLHYFWRKLHSLSNWYFLLAAILFVVIGIFAMRQNNLNAIKLRDKVSQVDQQNGDVETALRELRTYVYSHMNTDLSSGTSIQQPVQLKYRYERLVKAEKERVTTANSQIYTEAQAHCERLHPASRSGGPRIPCIEAYVTERGIKEEPIPDALYKFSFTSPRWSPDLAGISLLLGAVFFLAFIVKFIADKVIKTILNQHL